MLRKIDEKSFCLGAIGGALGALVANGIITLCLRLLGVPLVF